MKKKTFWKPEFAIDAYELAREGLSDEKIAAALGVSPATIQLWKRKRPGFRYALKQARKGASKCVHTEDFREYVYNRLPPRLQALWDLLQECEEEPNAVQRIEALLANEGKNTRQHLFLYALSHYNFSQSAARRALNLSRDIVRYWTKFDPDFAALIDELHQAKKDFFESALVGLVARGDSPATIFANKTLNRDRGYGEKIEHEHTGAVQHNLSVVAVDDLQLPLEVRKQILDALRNERRALTVEAAQ